MARRERPNVCDAAATGSLDIHKREGHQPHLNVGTGWLAGQGVSTFKCTPQPGLPTFSCGYHHWCFQSSVPTTFAICSPNVRTDWSMITFSFKVFAVCDVAADEELTYLYTSIEGSTAQRNEDLKPYDFVCTCRSCKDPKSDARRAYLEQSGPPSIPLWLFDDAPQASATLLEECRRQMAIIEREGMEAVYRYYEVLSAGFVVCVATGDAQSASEWARKLVRIRCVEEVPKDIESFVDPNSRAYKAHPMWRKRFDRDSNESWDVMMKGLAAMKLGGIIVEN
ncbi:hypothetical protein FB45DRAFT_738553 [Roridomyces roridus]|uniref:SET domain-containing protein n=1 Tax=Roridomyces roridus TaxID=1738132 RepID=A0AAD7C912_9AGAR|nr:hypothetical protein FB45DRAFT_738553 [Roridomyces roridus]